MNLSLSLLCLFNGASLKIPVESLHGLPLRFAHFEVVYTHFVLVAFAARSDLVTDVAVGSAPCESAGQQHLIVFNLELVGRET